MWLQSVQVNGQALEELDGLLLNELIILNQRDNPVCNGILEEQGRGFEFDHCKQRLHDG